MTNRNSPAAPSGAFEQAWLAGLRHIHNLGGGDVTEGGNVAWIKANFYSPYPAHLIFRIGAGLYFVHVELAGRLGVPIDFRTRFIEQSIEAGALPCVMVMVEAEGGFCPVEGVWGLRRLDIDELVTPSQTSGGTPVVMSGWDVHDCGIQAMAKALRSKGKDVCSWQSSLRDDPSIWFEDSLGEAWVVVRSARYPQRDADRPNHLDAIRKRLESSVIAGTLPQ